MDLSAHWYLLGLQLKVKIGTLESIQAQFAVPKRQLLEMLKTWLTTSDNTTWIALTNALRSQSVGASQLAGVLEKKYCQVKGTDVDKGTSALTAGAIFPSPVSLHVIRPSPVKVWLCKTSIHSRLQSHVANSSVNKVKM